ncbi:unnamed protein product [Kluyveromyces dobzhanskii CBS 2104]|uniref:WGS project CCBQ000000000 data, contig 00016 n=1 Tax=Kluyveromyces dobzhanskii CBS 2104 TaxID=1427455 RepID=A0A0A8L0D9_9SACH|nr:unnamed protein product [Kluyveromyces dobzhanskii CBS 2104]
MRFRVYGNFGKFHAIARRHLDNAEVLSSDEDIFTSSDDEGINSSKELDRTHDTSPAAPEKENDSSLEYAATAKQISETVKTDPFDILDELPSNKGSGSTRKKRKVTRLPKRIADDCDETHEGSRPEEGRDIASSSEVHEFQTTIDSLSSMISSLKDSEDVISSYSQVKSVQTTTAAATTQVRYGRTRTLLKKESHDEKEEDKGTDNDDDDDDDDDDEGQATNQLSCDSSFNDPNPVIHVNQLKTLGEGLKYEDDLEFLQYITTDEKLFTVKLLSCSLQLSSSAGLTNYIKKYKTEEVWQWVLQNIYPHNEVVSYLQLCIAHTIPMPPGAPQWKQLSPIMMRCSSLKDVPELKEGSKITKLNYTDFVQLAEQNPQELSFTLWKSFSYPDRNEFVNLIGLLHDPTPQLFDLIEQYLETFITEAVMTAMLPNILSNVATYIDDVNVIKIMVKLTNRAFFLNLLSLAEKTEVVDCCLSYVIKVSKCQTQKHEFDDIIILQLGLVLNIVANNNVESQESVIDEIRTLIETSHLKGFLDGLLALVFVLLTKTAKCNLSSSLKASITDLLNCLSTDMKETNETIYNNAQTALKMLKSV